ncbi:MAG: hypothetical protein R3E89_05975 [Thiolinea sp.]
MDADKDGLDDGVDSDPANFGPATAWVTDVLAAYPVTSGEPSWRKPNAAPAFT